MNIETEVMPILLKHKNELSKLKIKSDLWQNSLKPNRCAISTTIPDKMEDLDAYKGNKSKMLYGNSKDLPYDPTDDKKITGQSLI